MKTAIVVVCIIVAVIFLGGAVSIGGAPVFGHIDRLLKTDVLMNVYRTAFFFFYSAEESVESGLERTDSKLREFQERPAGIDKKEKDKQLEDATK